MILFVNFAITLQGRITLLSDLDIGQPHRTRLRVHQGRKGSKKMREGIRDKMVLSFGINNGDTREKFGSKSSQVKLLSTQVGL